MAHDNYVRKQRDRTVATCQAMIAGELSIILGSRQLTRLLWEVDVRDPESDPDFHVFRAIDSESDHLPVGEERRYWAKSALLAKDQEIQIVERAYAEVALEACRSIIQRFQSP